jgi:hypothetical protein
MDKDKFLLILKTTAYTYSPLKNWKSNDKLSNLKDDTSFFSCYATDGTADQTCTNIYNLICRTLLKESEETSIVDDLDESYMDEILSDEEDADGTPQPPTTEELQPIIVTHRWQPIRYSTDEFNSSRPITFTCDQYLIDGPEEERHRWRSANWFGNDIADRTQLIRYWDAKVNNRSKRPEWYKEVKRNTH